jgi:hypothetical protein
MPMLRLDEKRTSLWVLPASPALWAAHFLLCYVTAAIWCAKVAPPGGSLWTVRIAIGVYTLVAIGGVAWFGYVGWRAHRFGSGSPPHDEGSPEDRHRFMGFATLLLSGLSAIAIVYAALVVAFIGSCD